MDLTKELMGAVGVARSEGSSGNKNVSLKTIGARPSMEPLLQFIKPVYMPQKSQASSFKRLIFIVQ